MFDDDFEQELDKVLTAERPARTTTMEGGESSGLRRRMTVGRADDPAERTADKMADDAVAGLRRLESAPGGVRREAQADPLGGMEVSNDVQRQIDSRRGGGSQLASREAEHFSDAYGSDLSGVRIHTDSTADTLSRSLQADAFSTGQDVFFRKGAYRPGTAQGDHLIGHELAHVATEGGAPGARRSVRRFMSVKQFDDLTYMGVFSSAGKHKDNVMKMLAEFHKLKEAGKGTIQNKDLTKAASLVEGMIDFSEDYFTEHSEDGKTPDEDIKKRWAGFKQFHAAATKYRGELEEMRKKAGEGGKEVPVDARAAKLRKHMDGDPVTLFTKVGAAIASLVPEDGDSAEFKIELKIPVMTGVFVGGELGLSAEHDGTNYKARAELKITAGGEAGIAEIKGALGGYIEAQGASGEMLGQLLEYGLYRRCAESNMVPAEVQNYLFGGDSGARGARRAAKKAEAVELAAFGDGNEDNYVETGGLASVEAELGFQGAKMGISGGYAEGKRTDAKSLAMAGMTAGGKKEKDDTWASRLTGGARGAEKSTGRTVRGFNIAVGLSAPFEVEGAYEAKWMSEPGPEGKPGKMEIDTNELSFTVNLTSGLAALAGDEVADKVNGYVSKLISYIETQMAKKDAKSATDREKIQLKSDLDQTKGDLIGEVESGISEQLGNVKDAEGKDAIADEGKDYASTEKVYESKGSFEFAVAIDFKDKKVGVTLTESTSRTLNLGALKIEAKTSSKKGSKEFGGGKS